MINSVLNLYTMLGCGETWLQNGQQFHTLGIAALRWAI
jgi:hypothetical protein